MSATAVCFVAASGYAKPKVDFWGYIRENFAYYNFHYYVTFGRDFRDVDVAVEIFESRPFFINEIFRNNNIVLFFCT